MGFLDRLSSEFIDIIEWPEQDPAVLVWKFPRYANEIKEGAKLIVREAQQAVFINEGKIADVFAPGTYTLSTKNLPILATLKGWKYGFESPFKADVFFVSTKQAIDQKWGTKNAVTLSDDRFGLIEIRAFGSFAYKITDAGKFLQEVVGIKDEYITDEINGQLKSIIFNRFSTAAGSGNYPIEKFASNLESISTALLGTLNIDFEPYGLKLTNFIIENVSMPDDLKKEIFGYSRLGKVDMQKLAQLRTAESIPIAAANEGIGGIGAGLGAGFGVGNMMANTIGQATTRSNVPPSLPITQYFTGIDNKQAGPFDVSQIQQMISAGTVNRDTLIWKSGMTAWDAAEKLSELQSFFNNMPPPLV